MTRTDPDAQAPAPLVLIRYLNQCGALVTVTQNPNTPGQPRCYGASCAGCLDALFGTPTVLSSARDWASKHARECRALPQPDQQAA